MKALAYCALLSLSGVAASVPAQATIRTLSTTIVGYGTLAPNVFGRPAETSIFQISTLPASTGCTGANNGWFAFSPATIADAQTRKNFTASLLAAKLAGTQVLLV